MASFTPQASGTGSSSREQGCSVDSTLAATIDDGSSNEDCEGVQDKCSDVDISDMEQDSDASSESDDDASSESNDDASSESNDDSSSESDDDATASESGSLQWSKKLHPVHPPKFSGPNPGATVTLSSDKRALDYFFLFFPAFLIQLLVLETNRYAAQQQEACGKEAKWTPVTYPEMQAFLGMRVAMSILYLPRLHNYWSKDGLLGNLGLANVLPRERFYKISRYFHAADSRNNPPPDTDGHDKLHHVRTILDTVNSNCRSLYHPHCNSSVDEAIIQSCREKSNSPRFNPNKTTLSDFKVWMRSDPSNGYCNEFKVYSVMTKSTYSRITAGLARSVVLDLTKDLNYCSYIVNVKSMFTSVALFDELKRFGILARGNIGKLKKGFPRYMMAPTAIEPVDTIQRGDMTAYKWPDKKETILLSTADDPVEITSVLGEEGSGKKKAQYPSAISNYCENMDGVDRYNQSRSHLSTARAEVRWWQSLFWFVFDLAIANALVLLKESGNNMKTHSGKMKPAHSVIMEDFRHALAIELIDGYEYRFKNQSPSKPVPSVHRYVRRADKKQKRCSYCMRRRTNYDAAGKKRGKDTRHICDACELPFCSECFPLFHIEKKFKYE